MDIEIFVLKFTLISVKSDFEICKGKEVRTVQLCFEIVDLVVNKCYYIDLMAHKSISKAGLYAQGPAYEVVCLLAFFRVRLRTAIMFMLCCL